MGLEEVIPSIALILVLILVLPTFIKSNLKKRVFFKKLKYLGYYCFSSYDISIFYLLMKKINLAISGCMGRMGQQLIKSSKKNKNFKLVTLTENRLVNKKFNGIKPEFNFFFF